MTLEHVTNVELFFCSPRRLCSTMAEFPVFTHNLTEDDVARRRPYVPSTISSTMTTLSRRKGRLKKSTKTQFETSQPILTLVPSSRPQPSAASSAPSSPALEAYPSSDFDELPSSDFNADFFASPSQVDPQPFNAENPAKRIRVCFLSF